MKQAASILLSLAIAFPALASIAPRYDTAIDASAPLTKHSLRMAQAASQDFGFDFTNLQEDLAGTESVRWYYTDPDFAWQVVVTGAVEDVDTVLVSVDPAHSNTNTVDAGSFPWRLEVQSVAGVILATGCGSLTIPESPISAGQPALITTTNINTADYSVSGQWPLSSIPDLSTLYETAATNGEGTAGQTLVTDGSGNNYWGDAGSGDITAVGVSGGLLSGGGTSGDVTVTLTTGAVNNAESDPVWGAVSNSVTADIAALESSKADRAGDSITGAYEFGTASVGSTGILVNADSIEIYRGASDAIYMGLFGGVFGMGAVQGVDAFSFGGNAGTVALGKGAIGGTSKNTFTADGFTKLTLDGVAITEWPSGNVTKVGTPVDNQIGVWKGDGTLEGDSGLTWDGTNLTATAFVGDTATITNKLLVGSAIDTGEALQVTGDAMVSGEIHAGGISDYGAYDLQGESVIAGAHYVGNVNQRARWNQDGVFWNFLDAYVGNSAVGRIMAVYPNMGELRLGQTVSGSSLATNITFSTVGGTAVMDSDGVFSFPDALTVSNTVTAAAFVGDGSGLTGISGGAGGYRELISSGEFNPTASGAPDTPYTNGIPVIQPDDGNLETCVTEYRQVYAGETNYTVEAYWYNTAGSGDYVWDIMGNSHTTAITSASIAAPTFDSWTFTAAVPATGMAEISVSYDGADAGTTAANVITTWFSLQVAK